MTLHQLEVFATVAKLGSFTEAGEKLHIAQPAVSKLIQTLERELEVELFERLGNKYHLTSAGERLLRHAEEMLAKAEAIKERMDEIKGLKKEKLTVGGSAIAVASFLTIAIQLFKKDYPGIEIILTIQRSEVLETKLLEGELHVAIMSWFPRSPLLAAELYRQDDVVVIAPPSHPLTRKRLVPLELLAREPVITYEKGNLVRDMVEKRFANEGLKFTPLLEVNLQLGSRDAVKSAVASGLGIGFISKSYVLTDVEAGQLKLLKVPELELKRNMYIALHKNRQTSFLVRAFIDFLRHQKGQL